MNLTAIAVGHLWLSEQEINDLRSYFSGTLCYKLDGPWH
jgi:hypothetical protein